MNIGIIGQGFVGSAIREGLKNFYKIRTYDINDEKCNSTHQEVCYKSDIIFVCVPTPMRKSGECDTRILESVIEKLNKECRSDSNKNRPILVIKSTVPPSTSERLNKIATILDVCFSPEFLTEANSFKDFKNQTRIIIGGNTDARCAAAKKVKQMFRKPFPKIPIIITKWETAEMVKYFTNCFLATKVSFSNEIRQICEKTNIDYDKVVEYGLYDTRIGKSHFSSPGPDGSYGFGGHCFPKDINALMFLAREKGIDPSVLQSVWAKNLEVRSPEHRDWEAMSGRAVSED